MQPAHSRREHSVSVHFSTQEMEALDQHSRRLALSRAACLRLLVQAALTAEASVADGRGQLHVLVLACLVATEQWGLLLQTIVPSGRAKTVELGGLALDAARDRLEELRLGLERG